MPLTARAAPSRRRHALACLVLALILAAALAGFARLAALLAPGPRLPAGARADAILVDKSDRTLTLLAGGAALGTYRVSLGFGEPGPKRRHGDGRTPEGRYRIESRNPASCCHLALRVSYPDAADHARAAAAGVSPGGDIMIHGLPNGRGGFGALHRLIDWTSGCIAVTDAEMDDIWRAVPDGTPIEIRP